MIWFDADKGGAGAGAGGNPGDDGPATGAGAETRSYTQAELDQMFADRAKQAQASLLKKLGFEKTDDAVAALGKLKSIEDGQKSDLQKAQDTINELTTANTELTNKQKEQMTQYEVMIAAGKLGIVDADAAYRLLDKGKLEFDKETGEPKNVEDALKGLLIEKPWLGGSGTSASNRAKNHGDNHDPTILAARKAAGLPVEDK